MRARLPVFLMTAARKRPGESAMKFGVAIRNMGPASNRATIRACARIAEQAGFDALFVSDHLCIIHHLFSADVPVAYDGPLVNFPSFVFLPGPKRPSIWIGGNGPAAMNRAVKFGDGWHPMLPAAELKAKVEELHAGALAAGRAV